MSFFNPVVPPNLSLYLPLAGGTMSGAILANADNTLDFGSPGARWKTVWAYTADLNSGINGSSTIQVTMSTPGAAGAGGFSWTHNGGPGAAGNAGTPGGVGGAYTATAGMGGAGSAAQVAGNGGNYSIDGGGPGANNGGGAGTAGVVNVGTNAGKTSAVNIGNASATTKVNGTFRYDNTNGGANAGGASLPAQPTGFLVISVAGVNKKVPYYEN